MTHTLIIKIGPSTVRSTCSCGQKCGYARGCNRGGMDYALSYGWQEYARHCKQVKATPMIPGECKGLAGVEVA